MSRHRRPSRQGPRRPRHAAGPRRRRPRKASHGGVLGWLLLFAVVFLSVAYVGTRGDDQPSADAVATTAEIPVRVTFPEGLRREEMAEIVARETSIDAQRYLALTAPGPRGRSLSGAGEDRSLEGFLFPATYDIYRNTTAKKLVDQQVGAYRQRTAGINYRPAATKNLTKYDVLIIASMIEREVRVAEERPLVASVIYNRLRNGMTLGIDATVQYALGEWKQELTVTDLDIDSPYNTRKFGGLPPGPICNPGEASLIAAAKPANTSYLYYVAKNDGTGEHYFTNTAAEFEEAVARARSNGGG